MDEKKRVEVERWFIKAGHDIEMARRSLEKEPILTDMACFHAQQCAEKSLKAFLVFHDQHVEKTHDLLKIVGLCSALDDSFEPLLQPLKGMSQYAAEIRYTDDWREILLDEAQLAVKNAEECMAFVKGKIKW